MITKTERQSCWEIKNNNEKFSPGEEIKIKIKTHKKTKHFLWCDAV